MSSEGGLPWAAKLAMVALGGVFVVGAVGMVGAAGLLFRFQRTEDGAGVASKASSPTETARPQPLVEGPSIDRIRKNRELRVLMDTGTPAWTGNHPVYFLNGEGQPDGLDYQLALKISAAIGVPTVKIIHTNYPELAGALKNPTQRSELDADLVIAGFVPWSEPGISWSESYLEFGLCLLVPMGSPIKTIDGLWGKKIGIYPDDAAEREVKRLVRGYTSLDRIEHGYFDLLLSGKLDAYIYDYPFTVSELNVFYSRFPQHQGRLKIAQYNLTDSTYNVAIRESEQDLLAAVNQTIQSWRDTPDYEASVRKYLSGGASVEVDAVEPGMIVSGTRTYTIKAGETLASIAATEYKNPSRWLDIWAANKSRIANPNLLEPGGVLVLPP